MQPMSDTHYRSRSTGRRPAGKVWTVTRAAAGRSAACVAEPAQAANAVGASIGTVLQLDFHPWMWSGIGWRLGLAFAAMSGSFTRLRSSASRPAIFSASPAIWCGKRRARSQTAASTCRHSHRRWP